MSAERNAKCSRVAVVVSHPIQHFVPFYRRLAQEDNIDLHVFYMSDFSVRGSYDPLMDTRISWAMDLLSGYQHTVLPEAEKIDKVSTFGLNNPSIVAALKNFQPDIVIGYGYSNVTQWRLICWSVGCGVPLVMISDSELLRKRKSLHRLVKAIILPTLFSHFSAFLVAGDSNAAYLKAYGVPADKMFLCPLTIDEERYVLARSERKVARARFRTSIGISEDVFLVVTIGKLSTGKRPMDVLDAARKITSRLDGATRAIQFALAGDGALRSDLEEQVSAEGLPVRFLGFVNVDRLPDVYCGADLLLHPSEIDAHPLTLSEAACVGLPMIVSNKVGAVGTSDIARIGENAIVTPSGDVEAIANGVVQLSNNLSQCRRMSESSVRIYSELDMSISVSGLRAAIAHCESLN